ncbi:hypothetical protein B0H34DRAFT_300764 [Crassisporium funariophilum]|nr:hypothetical protein B0H34DRAFT_300764 [Crassisporium funariophilum]
MAEPSTASTAGSKRKRPPTFQHLPVETAKKFKKAWVEKTKIKSKWKAEKRKEGLASSSRLELPVYDREGDENFKDVKDVEDEHSSESEEAEPMSAQSKIRPETTRPHVHPSRSHIHPDLVVKQSKHTTTAPASANTPKTQASANTSKKTKEGVPPVEPPSLRELTREAFSQSTLHTFKSDPLKRRERGGKSGVRGQNGRGRGRGRGRGQGEIGRGQPNMKLRMNAMLEKIKQDFT